MSAVYLTLAEKLAEVLASPGGQKVLLYWANGLVTKEDVARAISTMSELAARPKGNEMEKGQVAELPGPVAALKATIEETVGLTWTEIIQDVGPALLEGAKVWKDAWAARAGRKTAIKLIHAIGAVCPLLEDTAEKLLADAAD